MNSQIVSYFLMAVGAVLALIFAAGPLATSLLSKMLFGASLSLLACGAALRRTTARLDALSGSADGEVRLAHAALESLHHALQQAQADCESIEGMTAFHSYVQEKTQPPVRDFLQHRQSLLDAYGFGPFAELMIRFASVERAINRTLSASADDVGSEARTCLKLANLRMEACLSASNATEASQECT